MTANLRGEFTITMICNKNIASDICIYLSPSEFSKNEIRSANGIIMKELFTTEFRVISANSINNGGGRSISVEVRAHRKEWAGQGGGVENQGRKEKKKKEMKTLLIIPLVGAISLYFKPSKQWALMISVATMIEALRLYVTMDKKSTEYQLVEKIV